jgi:hypothetical protein
LPSYAILSQVFETNSNSSGHFTRYGGVTDLVLTADEMYVVGRQGDSVHLKFTGLTSVPEGMVRDYFVVASSWFKGQGLPYVHFTVDSLPFHNMTSYPYPSTESYPNDVGHSNYILQYNNRTINAKVADTPNMSDNEAYNKVSILELSVVFLGFALLLILAGVVFAHRRKK